MASGRPKGSFDPNKMYDVSEAELRAIQERAKVRSALKEEFQKKVTNPYRGTNGYVVSELYSVSCWVVVQQVLFDDVHKYHAKAHANRADQIYSINGFLPVSKFNNANMIPYRLTIKLIEVLLQ